MCDSLQHSSLEDDVVRYALRVMTVLPRVHCFHDMPRGIVFIRVRVHIADRALLLQDDFRIHALHQLSSTS